MIGSPYDFVQNIMPEAARGPPVLGPASDPPRPPVTLLMRQSVTHALKLESTLNVMHLYVHQQIGWCNKIERTDANLGYPSKFIVETRE